MNARFRIGADENGLGAQLGPLVVTAVLAEVTDPSAEKLWKRLPSRVSADLNDSKRLIAHGSVTLGEAWARALLANSVQTPAALFRALSLETEQQLQAPCPKSALPQCWHSPAEAFLAQPEEVARIARLITWLEQKGLKIIDVKTSITCTKLLNEAQKSGHNRFVADLHTMERLVLHLRGIAGSEVHAVCGKVGGIGDYSRYFGPLSHRLHAVLQAERAHSAYRFPGLGEVHFVQDADAHDPLVMMASLVGKYVRELLMTRISFHYQRKTKEGEPLLVSGYNDPRSDRFITLTAQSRRAQGIPKTCFQRAAAVARKPSKAVGKAKAQP